MVRGFDLEGNFTDQSAGQLFSSGTFQGSALSLQPWQVDDDFQSVALLEQDRNVKASGAGICRDVSHVLAIELNRAKCIDLFDGNENLVLFG